MPRSAFLETPDDIQWLKDTALRGVPLPAAYADFKFAILQGNEDSPYAVNLYAVPAPTVTDNYLRVTFDHAAPVYCECAEYDGTTDKPITRATVPEIGYYRGWAISFDRNRPVTGQWRAERHGVGLCHSDRAALLRMVDTKIAESESAPAWRQPE